MITQQLVVGFLPVPFVFLLWLRQLEKEGEFATRFSPIAMVLCLLGYASLVYTVKSPIMVQWSFAAITFCGLFVLLPFTAFIKRALRHLRLMIVALIAASAVWDYYWLMRHFISHQVLSWTSVVASHALDAVGVDIIMNEDMDYPLAFDLLSLHFKITMYPVCGGLEGIFLFIFMLSAALLLDWERLKGKRLMLIYPISVIGMFFVNVLRITCFFLIGYRAFTPGVSTWEQAFQGVPLHAFHSYAGWLLDLCVFGLFSLWLYKPGKRSLKGGL